MSDKPETTTTPIQDTTTTTKQAAVVVPKNENKRQNTEKKKKFELKTPKGTQDYGPSQMVIREKVFSTIKNCFNKHGAVTIETPVFELRETLTGKYGEDSKLIFDLEDQGGEICSLRYDLTVPFARYVAMNGLDSIKRYHIARVYRRDNPVMNKGRFREFYQCDFDIAGTYDLMVPDAECLRLITEILDSVKVGNYIVKINHRKLLDAIFAICGVPSDLFRPICSAVDKLDKTPWLEVRKEMVEEKKLDPSVADKIEKFVVLQGKPFELLKKIEELGICSSSKDAIDTLADLKLLFQYCEALGCIDRLSFDLSLARGLDYYTGVIYEAVLTDQDRIGSIAAGGRYDGLVGMYGKRQVPAVGFSIGIERIFAILEEEAKKSEKKPRQNTTQVFIAQFGKGKNGNDLLIHRLKLVDELWRAGISAEYTYKINPNPSNQSSYIAGSSIPFVVYLGDNEIQTDTVSLKTIRTFEQVSIPRSKLIETLKLKIQEESEVLESTPLTPTTTTTTTTTSETSTSN